MSGSAANLDIKLSASGVPAVEAAFERVEQRLNTQAGAQRRLEAEVVAVEKAFGTGRISAERYGQVMDGLKTRMAAVASDGFGKTTAAGNELQGILGGITSRAGTLGTAFGAMGTGGLAAGAGMVVLAGGLMQVARAGDEMVGALGRIRAATGSLESARDVYDQLYGLSVRTGQSVAETAGQFARFSIATKEVGATNAQAVQLVSLMQKAAALGGASTQEAASAAMQLGQALASGVLQGEELRSLLENMPNLAVMLARELGVGVGQLRKMGADGELTANVVLPALLRSAEAINQEYDKMPVTMSRAFDQLKVSSGRFLADLDQAIGLSQALARGLGAAASALDGLRRRAFPDAGQAAASNSAGQAALVARLQAQLSSYETQISAATAEAGAGASRDPVVARLQAEREQVQALLNEQTAAYRQAEMERLAIGRDAREMDRAERDDAAAKQAENRRQASANEVEELRKTLDRRSVIQKTYEESVQRINRAVANSAIPAAEGERLIAAALAIRTKALEDLTKKAEGATRATRNMVDVFEINEDGSQGAAFQRDAGAQRLLDRWRGQAERKAEAEAKTEERAREKREREQERELERRQQREERVTDDIVQYGSERFSDMLLENEGGWNRTWQNMRRTALSLLARVAAEAVIRPVVQPVVAGMMGSTALSSTASAAGAGSGGGLSLSGIVSGARSIWDSWGSGTVSAGLDSWGASNLGFLGFQTTGASGLGTAAAGGSAFALDMSGGAAGLAMSQAAPAGLLNGGSALGGFSSFGNVLGIAGSVLPGLMSGNYVQAGLGGAGAALGTALFPGLGTVIGGIAGNLLGGLFGGKETNPAGSVQLGTDANGNLVVQGSKSKNYDMTEALTGANSTVSGLNTALGTRGLRLNSGLDISQIHYGKDANGTDQQDLVRNLLANITGGSDSVMAVIAREVARDAEASLEEAFSNVDWVKGVYEPLTETKEVISPFDQSVDALMTTFDAAKARAQELGLATDVLVKKQLEQVFALQQQRDATVWGLDRELEIRSLRATGKDEQADLMAFDMAALAERQARRANLESLGLTAEAVTERMLRLEVTLGQERLAIAERYADQVKQAEQQAATGATGIITSLADYARSLAYGDSSPLGAQDQYEVAQARFRALQEAYLSGDASALGQLQGLSQDYLTASRNRFGSGAGYADAYDEVLGILERVGTISPDTLTASVFNQSQETVVVRLEAASARLLDEVAGLRRELQQTNARGSQNR